MENKEVIIDIDLNKIKKEDKEQDGLIAIQKLTKEYMDNRLFALRILILGLLGNEVEINSEHIGILAKLGYTKAELTSASDKIYKEIN